MEALEHDLSDVLRAFAREGVPPSRMLREVVGRAGRDRADRQFLARLLAAAFRFEEGEGHVVFGWFPDGTGELTDGQLDYHLSKRIQAARPRWDVPQGQSAS
jgi:hypothetical protein